MLPGLTDSLEALRVMRVKDQGRGGKNRFQGRKDEDGNRGTGGGMRTESTRRVDWSLGMTSLIIEGTEVLFVSVRYDH